MWLTTRLSSLWPVNTSVLFHNELIYTLAGRNSYLDGGIHLSALDPATGALLWSFPPSGWKGAPMTQPQLVGERSILVGLGDGAVRLSLRQLGNASEHSLQILHERYPPGTDTGPDMLSHEGEEAGIVVSGVIEITVDEQVRVLNPGEGYLFDSRLPHRFRNIGDSDCIVVSACTPPTF